MQVASKAGGAITPVMTDETLLKVSFCLLSVGGGKQPSLYHLPASVCSFLPAGAALVLMPLAMLRCCQFRMQAQRHLQCWCTVSLVCNSPEALALLLRCRSNLQQSRNAGAWCMVHGAWPLNSCFLSGICPLIVLNSMQRVPLGTLQGTLPGTCEEEFEMEK